jgi:hypothetical protein
MKQFAITIKPYALLKLAPRTLLSDYHIYPTAEQAETVMRNLNPVMIDKLFFWEGAADSMKVMEMDPNDKDLNFGVKDIVVMNGNDLTGFFPEDINPNFWWLVGCNDMDLRANIAAERKTYIKHGKISDVLFGVEILGNREKIGTFVKWIIERLPKGKEFATHF